MKIIYLRQKNAAIPSLLNLINEVFNNKKAASRLQQRSSYTKKTLIIILIKSQKDTVKSAVHLNMVKTHAGRNTQNF